MGESYKKLLRKCLKHIGPFILLSLPVVIFLGTLVTDKNGWLRGDWDYFAQLYEAARRSILEFHQFPWWNAWNGGGIPLYANPQFGLVSIQMPLVLLFGTLQGLRIAVLAYYLLGFWGMRTLLLRVDANKIYAALLSYIWIFSSFPAWHIGGGHLTFASYLLAPWFFYFLLNIRKKWGWLHFGLFTAFLLNQSLHYITVHMLVIGAAVALLQIFLLRRKPNFSLTTTLGPYIKSAAVALPLVAHKVFFAFQYINDFPRIPPIEVSVPFNVIVAAVTFRGGLSMDSSVLYKGAFGWSEYASYFGLLTLGIVCYLIITKLENLKKLNIGYIFLLVGMTGFLLLALGDFSVISPYGIMKKLPVFNQMQVSPRWLGWFVFAAIILLAKLPRKKIFTILLCISVLDVFLSSYPVLNYRLGALASISSRSDTINKQAFYDNDGDFNNDSLRLYTATRLNVGDIFGYEPIVGFGNSKNEGYQGLTNRCASNREKNCGYVVSNNADVKYWSPNYVVLKRTSKGNIIINENPGSYWKVNGQRIFKDLDVIKLKHDFIITDSADELRLQVDPPIAGR